MKSDKSSQGALGRVPEGYITKLEVAQRLKKGLRTIDRWRGAGLIPYHKMGKFVYFRWADVEKQIAELSRVQFIKTMIKNQSSL